jgi:uncharacterized protein YecE (DUF72 family)
MSEPSPSGSFYSGMSGLALPFPKYKFPEAFQNSSRLTYYGSQFNSIEINRSFYALPNAKTVAKWAAEVPANFKFTFKLWKQVTHLKGEPFEESDVQKFIEAINNVGVKKGCLLIQFPPSVKIQSLPLLDHLLRSIQTNDPDRSWKVAIEFRDTSWYNDHTYALVDDYDATIVMHDKAKVRSLHTSMHTDFVYLRFHGPDGNYRGSYTDAFLLEYASYISEWVGEGKSVFIYFNNTMGKAFDNLKVLNEALHFHK